MAETERWIFAQEPSAPTGACREAVVREIVLAHKVLQKTAKDHVTFHDEDETWFAKTGSKETTRRKRIGSQSRDAVLCVFAPRDRLSWVTRRRSFAPQGEVTRSPRRLQKRIFSTVPPVFFPLVLSWQMIVVFHHKTNGAQQHRLFSHRLAQPRTQ